MEVTDEMVKRLRERIEFHCYVGRGEYGFHDLRLALEETLSAPAEPEVVVTEEMGQAGRDAATFEGFANESYTVFYGRIYRAMFNARPKEDPASHWIPMGGICFKCGDDNIFDLKKHKCSQIKWAHRRKDDPT